MKEKEQRGEPGRSPAQEADAAAPERDGRRGKRKKGCLAAGGALLLAAAVCAGMAWSGWREQEDAGKGYEALRREVKTDPAPEAEAEDPPDTPGAAPAEGEAGGQAEEIPVDFAALREKNPDICAWITIPGTQVDYPVLRREGDNAYYLTHTADGEEGAEGAIFMEDKNRADFTDGNTVLYGHNMKNGSMFQNLHGYADREYFDSHREVIVYLPGEALHYQVFAAYLYDSRHLLESFDFSDPVVRGNYIRSVLGQRSMGANLDTGMEPSGEDVLLTLSTCYRGQEDSRYLVQAALKERRKAAQTGKENGEQ